MPILISTIKTQRGMIIIFVMSILFFLSAIIITLYEALRSQFYINEVSLMRLQDESLMQTLYDRINHNDLHQHCYVDALVLKNPERYPSSWIKQKSCQVKLNDRNYYYLFSTISNISCAELITNHEKASIDFIKVLIFYFSENNRDIHVATFAEQSSASPVCSSFVPKISLNLQSSIEL